jgi:hypothetical protein
MKCSIIGVEKKPGCRIFGVISRVCVGRFRQAVRVFYNAGMGLKHLDVEGALRRLADRKIDEAMREGKFDNLPGFGKPLELEPIPAEENARLRWWAIRILKQNDITPDEVRWRKQIDGLKEELSRATTEVRVIALINAINALVRKINTLGTNALPAPVVLVSADVELERFRQRVDKPPKSDLDRVRS